MKVFSSSDPNTQMRLKLIFDLELRLVLRPEGRVGTAIVGEDACRRVTHDGILPFVRLLEDSVKGLQLLLGEARLEKTTQL